MPGRCCLRSSSSAVSVCLLAYTVLTTICLVPIACARRLNEALNPCFEQTLELTAGHANLTQFFLADIEDTARHADRNCVTNCVTDFSRSSSNYIQECFRVGGKILEFDAIVECEKPSNDNDDASIDHFSGIDQNIPTCVAMVCLMEELNHRLATQDFPRMARTSAMFMGEDATCIVTGNDRNRIQAPPKAVVPQEQEQQHQSPCIIGMMVFQVNTILSGLAATAVTKAMSANTSCFNNCVVDLSVTSAPFIAECFLQGGKIVEYDAVSECTLEKSDIVLRSTMNNVPSCIPLVCTFAELVTYVEDVTLPAAADIEKALIQGATCSVKGDDRTHMRMPPGGESKSKITERKTPLVTWIAGMSIVSLPLCFLVYQYWFRRGTYHIVSSSSSRKNTDNAAECELSILPHDSSTGSESSVTPKTDSAGQMR